MPEIDPQWLSALSLVEGLEPSPKNLERVGKMTTPEAARWAFTQQDLRMRGGAKFSQASQMLFIREALEQATHEQLARYHASLFPAGERVADLTTGIGGDLIALADRGEAVGFEIDPARAQFAQHNLAAHGASAEVRVANSLEVPWDFDYAYADPARRVEGRRTFDIDEFAPSPHKLVEKMQDLSLGIIKLSPMLPDAALHGLASRIEFLSYGGECREALAILGRDAGDGWFAVHVETGSRLIRSDMPAPVDDAAKYLFEADPAAIRAHGLGELCARFGIAPLGDSNGYLTGDEPVDSPWLRQYEVLYSARADAAKTQNAARAMGVSIQVFKQRGAGLELEKVKKQFRGDAGKKVALAIWPVGKSLRHTLLAY